MKPKIIFTDELGAYMNINVSLQSNWVAEDVLLFAGDGVGVVIRYAEC